MTDIIAPSFYDLSSENQRSFSSSINTSEKRGLNGRITSERESYVSKFLATVFVVERVLTKRLIK